MHTLQHTPPQVESPIDMDLQGEITKAFSDCILPTRKDGISSNELGRASKPAKLCTCANLDGCQTWSKRQQLLQEFFNQSQSCGVAHIDLRHGCWDRRKVKTGKRGKGLRTATQRTDIRLMQHKLARVCVKYPITEFVGITM